MSDMTDNVTQISHNFRPKLVLSQVFWYWSMKIYIVMLFLTEISTLQTDMQIMKPNYPDHFLCNLN